jgi:uncharacterized protein with PQ loop repeat
VDDQKSIKKCLAARGEAACRRTTLLSRMGDAYGSHEYLMNISTGLYLVCYIPELYANYKNKNANIWNVPEKIILFAGTSFSLAYGIMIQDSALIYNYAPLFCLDAIALGMRSYYAYRNSQQTHIQLIEADTAKSSSDGSSRDGSISKTTGTDTPQV